MSVEIKIHKEDERGNVLTLQYPLEIIWREKRFVVPAGFESDGVSTPRFLWSTVSPAIDPSTIRAGIAHDWLYRTQPADWTRAQADELFYDFCREDGLSWWKSQKAYWGLRLFGNAAWSQNTALLCGLFLCGSLLTLCGCAGETIANGLTTKNISGNGTVIDSHIGIDTDTKIPELETIFISGDFSTAKAGTNALTYREESSASAWNASSVTKKRFLSISLADKGDLPAVINAVAQVIRNSDPADDKNTSGNAAASSSAP